MKRKDTCSQEMGIGRLHKRGDPWAESSSFGGIRPVEATKKNSNSRSSSGQPSRANASNCERLDPGMEECEGRWKGQAGPVRFKVSSREWSQVRIDNSCDSWEMGTHRVSLLCTILLWWPNRFQNFLKKNHCVKWLHRWWARSVCVDAGGGG